MYFAPSRPRLTQVLPLIAVALAHLLMWQILLNQSATRKAIKDDHRNNIIFIPKLVRQPSIIRSKVENKLKAMPLPIAKAPKAEAAPPKPNREAQSNEPNQEIPVLNRDIKALTQSLEREWTQEERKIQAAKPPNQLVREYWEKQNHPYKDKWDQLANKIEQAGVPRGPQEENYTLDDGSRITKFNGICYKAPDPGRTYLKQDEVRRVFCPRN